MQKPASMRPMKGWRVTGWSAERERLTDLIGPCRQTVRNLKRMQKLASMRPMKGWRVTGWSAKRGRLTGHMAPADRQHET
ncbi:MAG: hypothetical protein MJY72_04010 [Bacteroidales bacterium]|nr:hypothetical protein [Bacteroidales bacterium]